MRQFCPPGAVRLLLVTLTFRTSTTALAIPVHADQAIDTLRRTVLVLRRVFRQFRLPLNFSAGKTEALVDAFGPGARALRMALWHTHACSVECADEHGSTTIRLCRAYKHLGSIVSVQANMSPEVLARTSAANLALGAVHAPFLSARNIEQLTKNAALSSFVLSRFFHLTPTWSKLNGTQMRKMEGTYRNLVRVASGCTCPDGIPARSLAQMLAKVSQPPLHVAMAAAPVISSQTPKGGPTALLILLDTNRSWRDAFRHDCLSMWLQATFVNPINVDTHRDLDRSLTFAEITTRRGVWGAIRWKVTQTGPQHAAALSEMQSKISQPTLKLIKETDKLVSDVKLNETTPDDPIF